MQIENHVRLEQAAAECFLESPNPSLLHSRTISHAGELRGHAWSSRPSARTGRRRKPSACWRLANAWRWPPAAELFHLGDAADSIYLVARGRLRLTLPMQVRNREEDVLVEERSSGQTVGWSALIPPYRFTLTATAPLETEVIALPARRSTLTSPHIPRPVTRYR